MAEQQTILYFDAGVPGDVASRQGRLVEFPANTPPDQIDERFLRYGALLLAEPEDFPFKPGDFAALRSHEHGITKELCIDIGKTALKAMRLEAGVPVALTTSILRRMYIMGLGIHEDMYTKGARLFANLAEFQRGAGSPEVSKRNRFSKWSTAQWTQAAAEVELSVGGKPTADDYIEYARSHSEFPGIRSIDEFAGGVGMLNELRGYPAVVRWGDEEYIAFGVNFVEINGEEKLLIDAFEILANKRRGPGVSSVVRNFDSWNTYKLRILEKITETQELLAEYRQQIESGVFPADWFDLTDEEILLRGARMDVINSLARGLQENIKIKIATLAQYDSFAPSLSRHINKGGMRNVLAGDVEVQASSMQLHAVIWPTPPCYIDHIFVTYAEIAEVMEKELELRSLRIASLAQSSS